jgi:GNAT superfamily N-acetyltransferase
VDVEQIERAAMADFYRAAPPELVEREGIAFLEDNGLLALSVATLSGSRMFNHAVGIASEDDLDKVDRFFRSRGCAYVVSPAHGLTLASLLARRGFVVDYAWMKFTRDAARVSADANLRVKPIGPEHAAILGRITCVAFGAPAWMAHWVAALPGRDGWTCFLSFAGDEPVGAGVVYLGGQAAWLGFGATLPEHRGKGSQSAIFAARITEAKEQGCTVVVTETGERTGSAPSASYRNILKAGFREAYLRPNWASHAPSA